MKSVTFTSRFLLCPPQDEPNPSTRWQALARQHNFDLAICIAAALKRGVLNEQEAKRYGKLGNNLAPEFKIVGLGQLVEACLSADRLMEFGG